MSAAADRAGAAGGPREVSAPVGAGRDRTLKRRTDGRGAGQRKRKKRPPKDTSDTKNRPDEVEPRDPQAEDGHVDYFA